MSQLHHPKGFRSNLFDIPFQYFHKHLERNNNCRILFSGQFGIGKTYFLEHFFKPGTQKEKLQEIRYNAVHLFPVNYSISANEDIFGYLKYDILQHFLEADITIEKKDLVPTDYVPYYLQKNILKVIANLANLVTLDPKRGKVIKALLAIFKNIKADFDKKAADATQDESKVLGEFFDQLEHQPGSLYENDLVTQIIAQVLARGKAKTNQENVLIIDDLDRIDPEHVFRILNVFAAHLDSKTSLANKLGFDKVMIVCDIQNLRSIFAARYGGNSDFNGYIDKFYSFDIFHFDNRQVLEDIAFEAFKSITFTDSYGPNPKYFRDLYFGKAGLATNLLTHLVQNGHINLRVLMNRIACNPNQAANGHVDFGNNLVLRTEDHPLLFNINILQQLARGYRSLRENMHKIPIAAWQIDNINGYCLLMLYYIHFRSLARRSGAVRIKFSDRTFEIPDAGSRKPEIEKFREVTSGIAVGTPEITFSLLEFLDILDSFLQTLSTTRYHEEATAVI